MRHITQSLTSMGFVIRKFKGEGAALALFASTGGARSINRPSLLSTVGVFAMIILIPMLLIALTATALSVLGGDAGVLMAVPAALGTTRKSGTEDKKPVKIREMETNLKSLAKELEDAQLELSQGPVTAERGEEIEQKAKEMEELQEQVDRYNRIAGVNQKARQVGKVTLPGEEGGSVKTLATTPGHRFIASRAFEEFKRSQMMNGFSAKVEVGKRLGKKVILRGEEALEFQRKAFDPATLSSLGDDAIIEIDRDRELVRYEEPEIMTIRDVLNVVPTTSDAIKYVKHISTTRAAASMASRGALKPYMTIAFEPDTVSVETIAVLSKVTEQDVADAPRLVGYINGEMTLDVRVEEERQLLWGSGASGQLKGLFHNDHAISEFDRAEVDDTVIDIIRKMRTDLRRRRVSPSFVLVDPLDWETIELSKGTDDHYIWGLITDLRGPRIWSMRVVESDAMTNADTGERRVLVGDGVRGATIYDRNNIQLAIGFVDDDFARNLRTLRAEERLALAVKRAFAFEYAVTEAAAS